MRVPDPMICVGTMNKNNRLAVTLRDVRQRSAINLDSLQVWHLVFSLAVFQRLGLETTIYLRDVESNNRWPDQNDHWHTDEQDDDL